MLPDAERFRRLVDGRLTGLLPTCARAGLALAAVPYGLAVTLRNASFDHHLRAIAKAPVPVVAVGNLTLGGTGKTPLVAWLARYLAERGWRPAVVSRGYGAARGHRSDEAAELGLLLPDTPHYADPRRIRAAQAAAASGATVVLLDDGLQHRQLARDLNLVVIDATDPFGSERLFPRGLLREPVSGLRRADAVILTRADRASAATRQAIRERSARLCRNRPLPWLETSHQPVQLRAADGTTAPLSTLANRRLFGFAGIGNPAAFQATLREGSRDLVGFKAFADHHPYDHADLRELSRQAHALNAEMAVTTLKDLVKLPQTELGGIPLVAVEIGIAFHGETGGLETLLAGLRPPAGTDQEADT